MTYKNEDGTLTDLSSTAESNINVLSSGDAEHEPASAGDTQLSDGSVYEQSFGQEWTNESSAPFDKQSERAEYERLIRTRFKEFYTDDTQKMINKRFKRYKAMEERISELEGQERAMRQREAELDALVVSEREKAVSETEQRVVSEMLASRQRPSENGYAPRRAPAPFNVSALTKSQRADIAKRAFGGEKISF